MTTECKGSRFGVQDKWGSKKKFLKQNRERKKTREMQGVVWRDKRDKVEGEWEEGKENPRGSQKPGLTELDSLVNSEKNSCRLLLCWMSVSVKKIYPEQQKVS